MCRFSDITYSCGHSIRGVKQPNTCKYFPSLKFGHCVWTGGTPTEALQSNDFCDGCKDFENSVIDYDGGQNKTTSKPRGFANKGSSSAAGGGHGKTVGRATAGRGSGVQGGSSSYRPTEAAKGRAPRR